MTETRNLTVVVTLPGKDHELIDSGRGRKLERFGAVVMSRPDPQALWEPRLPKEEWDKAHAIFTRKGTSGNWTFKSDIPKEWDIVIEGIKLWVKPTSFKHTGVFPEQSQNWKWIHETISNSKIKNPKVLNLFGYTGAATVAALKAGAEVVHVDGSKSAIGWAKDNVALNDLHDKPVRFMLDDVKKFVAREVRRGTQYHGIIMDPPTFGYGPKDEPWKIEEDLSELVDMCKKILHDDTLFVLLNGYAGGYSCVSYVNVLSHLTHGMEGITECGELAIQSSSDNRLLPAGIFVRWKKA